MAKKEISPNDRVNKILVTAIKKTVSTNAVIATLECVCLLKDKAVVSDLENYVVVPYESGVEACIYKTDFIDCLDIMGEPKFKSKVSVDAKDMKSVLVEITGNGSKKIKLTCDHPDQFVITPDTSKFNLIGNFNEQDMDHLAETICFVSNDDLRPAMTGVLCGPKMVATDAHRLVWHDISNGGLKEEFILPAKTAKILLALGGEWELYAGFTKKDASDVHVMFFRNDGVKVICRVIDARYPDYKVVVPDIKESILTLQVDRGEMMKEVKNAMKFANRSTNMVAFHVNGKIDINSQEIDFGKEYNSTVPGKIEFKKSHKVYRIKEKQFDELDGKLVTIKKKINDEVVEVQVLYGSKTQNAKLVWLEEVKPTMDIAFNGKFMLEFLDKQPVGNPVEIKLFSPTRAGIMNGNYLMMPLMLNSEYYG